MCFQEWNKNANVYTDTNKRIKKFDFFGPQVRRLNKKADIFQLTEH